MERLKKVLRNTKRIKINRILNKILLDKVIQQRIISLNIFNQLFDEGINSVGVKLDVIGGEYSPYTIEAKKGKGQPVDRITLRDTGAFYESFYITLGSTYFDINANPIKDGVDILKDRWGEDVLGLTSEIIELLGNILKPLIIEELKNEILR